MENGFHEFVARQVLSALPANWNQVPADKLLGKAPYRISHAFNSVPIEGKSLLINILVLPLSTTIDDTAEERLVALRDYILSKNCVLVVISEEEHTSVWGDLGVFISENLFVNSPYFLWLECTHEQAGKTTIDGDVFQELHIVLSDLWKRRIGYSGPKAGFQQVNLELMTDHCWKCQQAMKTVTGVVFPDRPLKSWANRSWKYFNSLLPLSAFDGENAGLIQQFVDQMRKTDPSVTPVGVKYSQTIKDSYLAASCPRCHALRGDHYVGEERISHLHDLDSRLDGSLIYHSIGLNITGELISKLNEEFEACVHTCVSGWEKK